MKPKAASFPTSLLAHKKPFSIESLAVEVGVPFAPRNCPTGKWQPLLDKMTAPGQSIAFPVEYKAAVAAFCLKRKKEGSHKNFRVAKIGGGQARIWFVSVDNEKHADKRAA